MFTLYSRDYSYTCIGITFYLSLIIWIKHTNDKINNNKSNPEI